MDTESGKKRDLPPANYTVEIKSYKKLFQSKATLERFESDLFEAGGYKWRLVFYPNGNRADDGAEHISLYLKIDQCNGFTDNWSVLANYKFFLQDKKNNTYFTLADAEVRRFDKNKKEWGFGQFLSLQNFNQPSNGFLIYDSCVFGVEVSVIQTTGKGETIDVLKNPSGGIQIWEITEFSKLDRTGRFSEEYTVGDRKWRLMLYPKRAAARKDEFLAISLGLVDFKDLPPKKNVYANFKLRLVDPLVHQTKCEKQYWNWFTTESNGCVDPKFVNLEILKEYDGYLKDDTLVITLEFLCISCVKNH